MRSTTRGRLRMCARVNRNEPCPPWEKPDAFVLKRIAPRAPACFDASTVEWAINTADSEFRASLPAPGPHK